MAAPKKMYLTEALKRVETLGESLGGKDAEAVKMVLDHMRWLSVERDELMSAIPDDD